MHKCEKARLQKSGWILKTGLPEICRKIKKTDPANI